MSLTPQDLQAIKNLLQEQKTDILGKVEAKLEKQQITILNTVEALIDTKLKQQTKDIAQVINTVMASADSTFATKLQVAELELKVGKIQRHLALDV